MSVFQLTQVGGIVGIDSSGLQGELAPTTDGFVLTLDSGEALGFKWAAGGGTPDADDVTYTPTTLADWDGGLDPGDVEQALDQLAERITDAEGAASHAEDHDHDGSPTQKLLAANTHESPSPDTHHAQSHGNGDHTTAFTDDTTVNNHIADTGDAHDASAISVDSTTLVGTGTDVQAVLEEVDDAIVALAAPDYLVGTATGTLAGEIVVGTSPGGELGGTWASPTVDATHSGSTHSAATDTHIADTSDAHAHGSIGISGMKVTLTVNGAGFTPAQTNGCETPIRRETSTHKVNYWSAAFDSGATDEIGFFTHAMPDNYDASTLTATPIWTALSGSGDVIWTVAALALRNDDALDTAYGTAITSTDTLLASGDVHIAPTTSAITPGGTAAAGCMMMFKVTRNSSSASDTIAADCLLMGLKIEFGITALST